MNKQEIQSFGQVFNGKTPSKEEQRSDGLPILKIRDIDENGQFRGVFGSFVDQAFYKRHEKKKLKTGDTIILNAAHNSDYVGTKSAFVSSELNGVIATGEWLIVRVKGAHPAYVNQFLKSPPGKESLRNCVKGIHLYPKDVERINIPVPPLNDQIRIAHLLGKVEGLIAQRKQHLQQLDDLLKSVFLEMFGDPVRNEKRWDVVPFHKVGQFVSGSTPSKSRNDYWNGTFPWVSPKDMKVSKIGDAEDHISEAVFEETSLKRIDPGHLLIVVRGMILAHSFPVAINTVEIAINQDMKAIKPTKEINVIYLQHCLVSLKRQILKLISTAGHGTRKFDSLAMQKLFIPKPLESLQIQFAAIVEKFEGIKSKYQQSLANLEALYGALSQQAFMGELDLSRVPLPDEQGQPTHGEHDKEQEQAERSPLPVGAITPTEVINHLVQAAQPQSRSELLARWLKQYLTNTSPDANLGSTQFLESAWQTLQEAQLETDGETPALTLDDYDALKDLIFKALASGELNQTFDEGNNRVALQKRPANWGAW